MKKRTLLLPHHSPLAAERAWHLSKSAMAVTGHGPFTTEIPSEALRSVVAELAQHVARTAWSRWDGARDERFDSDDVRWLCEHLESRPADSVRNPWPRPDSRQHPQGFVWRSYSPEQTRQITADSFRNALIGYRDLVNANFPGYAESLEFYRALPIRVEGTVVMPRPDDDDAWCVEVDYFLYPDPSGDRDAPDVQIDLVEERDHSRLPWPWGDAEEPEVRPLRSQTRTLQTHSTRQATNLAYGWLADDLTALGWMTGSPLPMN